MHQLRSLGELRLLGPDGEILATRRKELVLLVYLARQSPGTVTREALAALLWGDGDERRSRHSLRQALFELKRALGPVLETDPRGIGLRQGHVVLDATALADDLAAGRLSEAVARWRGEFLEGLEDLGGAGYRQWLEEEREGLRRQVVWALERLTSAAERAQAWREMSSWAYRWTVLEPLEEAPHHKLILALHQDDRTAEALAHHARVIARLRDAEAEPSPAFAGLTAGIQRSGHAEAVLSPVPGSIALFTPDLVGRVAELSELHAAWRAAREGVPTVVVLEGDDGSGKTRLAETFLRSIEHDPDPAFVLRVRGEAVGAARGEAWPLAAALLGPLRMAPGLAGAPDRALADLSELVPSLRERFPDLPPPRFGETALAPALVQVVGDVASETPVLIFIDDFAAADPPSLRLIASLARQLPDAAILLLVTAGDADTEATAELRSLPGARRIRLRPLSVDDVDALIASMLACADTDRRRLAERLHAEGDGNPMFVTETVAALVDDGRLSPDSRGYWRLSPTMARSPLPLPMSAATTRTLLPRAPTPPARRAWRRPMALPMFAAAAIGILVVATAVRSLDRGPVEPAARVLAVGLIRDYTGSDTATIARALPDMLATNLARVPALQVVSQARMYEILEQFGRPAPTAAALADAARRSGAHELIEGELYRFPGRPLRLELRFVDLETGRVKGVYDVDADDVFALVNDVTDRLALDISGEAAPFRVAGSTTTSLVAYRLYEEGLRAHYQGDLSAARRLLRAALAEDSVFGLAAYFVWRTEQQLGLGGDSAVESRIYRLAEYAPERERLLMRGLWASITADPAMTAVAETLVVRYPAEPDGHFLVARARLAGGEFLAALPHLDQVLRLDSLSLNGHAARCRACDAMANVITAYSLADSLVAAERVAREWVRRQPNSGLAWSYLAGALESLGRTEESLAAQQRGAPLRPGNAYDPIYPAMLAIRAGQFEPADRLLREQALAGTPAVRAEALWFWTISLRYQGRLHDALRTARALRRLGTDSVTSLPGHTVAEAQVLFELGRFREAAALFDSLAAFPAPDIARKPLVSAGWRTWRLTHAATALAAAGDTTALAQLVDSIQSLGAEINSARDRRLHHYARGLLLSARSEMEEAAAEFYRALHSLPFGFSRNNLELSRALLALGRTDEAITVLQPAFRGSLEVGSLYTTRTELHAQLGRAFEAAGRADSAATHYRAVLRAWRAPDPDFNARRDSIRARLTALGAGR